MVGDWPRLVREDAMGGSEISEPKSETPEVDGEAPRPEGKAGDSR